LRYLFIYDAINNSHRGNFRSHNSTNGGDIILGAVDTTCKRIPHTNLATKRARRDIETMQHHFGSPNFLTVTPDDDNHMLVQI
jgi:hypothetical protein